jgi:hypothetical protein
MKCGLRVVRSADPPCEQCGGDGFVPRLIRSRSSGGRKLATGKFATRTELVAEIWRRRAVDESRKDIAAALGISESVVSRVIDSKEDRPPLAADLPSTGPFCHFKPMQLKIREGTDVYVCSHCGNTSPV